ncbi:MAG: hypothetical protein H6684_04020 [Deltaproteobacteria bacterium]|nr:hypothetical protein [bacterium]MCB9477415.1 hypothetical protein [Deltaproteobacteria bacterium]MCB9480155.1 hypothetical protein [Deltaproteobacteria bacterium]MCB9487880.1 hypothetical protein [Deltaproteobacteria bacterium]
MALRRPALLALVLVAALSLMGSSCKDKRETRKVQEISSSLCEAANDFNRLIVWQNYRAASLMVVPSKRIDFLVEGESHVGNLSIENFSIVICQAQKTPPVRDLELPDTELPEEEAEDDPMQMRLPVETNPPGGETPREVIGKEEAVDAIEKDQTPQSDESLKEAGVDRPKGRKPKAEEVYYGTVLVRYINRTILPSARVDTKLVKQYWVHVGEVWYIDFDWSELVKR